MFSVSEYYLFSKDFQILLGISEEKKEFQQKIQWSVLINLHGISHFKFTTELNAITRVRRGEGGMT